MLINQDALNTIQQFKRKKSQLRQWLAQKNFAMLDAFLLQEEKQWLEDTQYIEDGYMTLSHINAFLFNENEPLDFLPFLSALETWQAHCPSSHHVHLLLGQYWSIAAGNIRGSSWADEVSEVQWLGAQLARDIACIYFLKAIELNPTPAFALYELTQIVSYLHEPEWLIDLFCGNPIQDYQIPNADDAEAIEVWNAAVNRIAELGGRIPALSAVRLPTSLPPRQTHELSEGRLYWMHCALRANPRNLYMYTSAVYYLYPRWFGDHEQIAAFIDGPLCAQLNEQEKGVLWHQKNLDFLDGYPDDDDVESINLHLELWEDSLNRALLPLARFNALLEYAEFLSYLERFDEAYRCYVEAVELQNRSGFFVQIHLNEFINFFNDVLDRNIDDTERALPHLLNLAAMGVNDPKALACLIVAKKFALLGFSSEEEDSHILMVLQQLLTSKDPARANHKRWSYKLPEYFLDSDYVDAALWLAEILAGFKMTAAMLFLADFYRQANHDDESVVDLAMAEKWQRRAEDLLG